jgi:hypothetical protein
MITTFRKATKLILLFALVFIISSCGSTRRSIGVEDGWELLGELKAGFIRETDVINVTSNHQFTSLRFKVEDHGIKLNELNIYFDNGDKLSPAIDESIAPGTESRIIDLARDGRIIKKIEFRYRTDGSVLKGKADVLVFGKKYFPGSY